MTTLTILKSFLGSRDAIERIAACRQAPWIGLLLVFSAALAREYDGQDLLHEPWHLLLPLRHRWQLLSCCTCCFA